MSYTKNIILGGGCFWCTEAVFKKINGVLSVFPGYIGGNTDNPTYREICTGLTGHAEVIKVDYDSRVVSLKDVLMIFFSTHDPTTLNRQGNDVGTQYRSWAYCFNEEQQTDFLSTQKEYQSNLNAQGYGLITTEIKDVGPFYYAEHYHQQYLAKNPDGYCGVDGTGVELT